MAEPSDNLGNSTPPDANIVTADSLSYWNSISADVNGMLGGFPQVSRIDLQGSRNFITKVRRLNAKSNAQPEVAAAAEDQPESSSPSSAAPTKTPTIAVDCGAGIGRVTSGLLSLIHDVVDAVEPIPKFALVLESSPLRSQGKLGDVYVQGLEQWHPTKNYDLVWNQWCVGHLTDAQLVSYLRRAAASLNPVNGWIGVKENLSTAPTQQQQQQPNGGGGGVGELEGEDIFDETDSSVTRSDAKFLRLFDEAGLVVIKQEMQTGFPRGLGLFPVKMYALRPKQK